MATQVITRREFGQDQGVHHPTVKLATARKVKFASKFGNFVRRRGIELGFLPPYQLNIWACEALSPMEKTRLNGDLMGL